MSIHLPEAAPRAPGRSAGPSAGLSGSARPATAPTERAARTVVVVSRAAPQQGALRGAFERSGFRVLEAADIADAERALQTDVVDLVVIESPILDDEELAFCRAASPGARPPILIVSANADLVEHIIALEVGADDLVVRPIDERLLMARVRALLRRTQAAPAESSVGRGAGWRLNPMTRKATSPGGRTISLSVAHAAAFHLFLTHPGVVFTCEAAARALGTKAEGSWAFRTMICRLRKKLDILDDGQPLQTVRGVGYVYAEEEERRPSSPAPVEQVAFAAPRDGR